MNRSAAPRFDPALLLKAQGRALGPAAAIFDVDGVLTDGRLFIGADGETFKAFHVLDGHGLKLLSAAGIDVLVITGRDSPAVRRRLADLGIARASFGVSDKLEAAQGMLASLHIDWADVAVIGDDWPDLPLIDRCGFSCAPPGAHTDVLAAVDYVTTATGGAGAVREFCDLLLHACGRYAALLDAQRVTLDAH